MSHFSEEAYMLWISRTIKTGHNKAYNLLRHFRSAEKIWEADKRALMGVEGITEESISAILSSKDEGLVESWIEELSAKHIRFISIRNRKYPVLLRQISDPPIGLYISGIMPDDESATLSIVGTRKCTDYGRIVTYKIAKQLAQENVVIISGMAEGIDSEAHKGALDGGGQTIAVLGCGVDVCYPKFNQSLMMRIEQSGCVISEYPPGTQPQKHHFPERNRIICGLSKSTLLTEAPRASGAGITVDLALDEGRDVYAVPGNITSKQSYKPNLLISQGAGVVTCAEDVLRYMGIEHNEDDADIKDNALQLSENERLVFTHIESEPIDVDALVIKTGIGIKELQYIITMLELKSAIQKMHGQRYIRRA